LAKGATQLAEVFGDRGKILHGGRFPYAVRLGRWATV
jgi:hypothetical protein